MPHTLNPRGRLAAPGRARGGHRAELGALRGAALSRTPPAPPGNPPLLLTAPHRPDRARSPGSSKPAASLEEHARSWGGTRAVGAGEGKRCPGREAERLAGCRRGAALPRGEARLHEARRCQLPAAALSVLHQPACCSGTSSPLTRQRCDKGTGNPQGQRALKSSTLVTGICGANRSHHVFCTDKDQ